MAGRDTAINERTNAGDAAADGLIAGAFAGVLMALYLLLAGLLSGLGSSLVLALFGHGDGYFVGALLHLGTASLYGIIYAVAIRWLLRRPIGPGWLTGLLYGLLLYGLARSIFLPFADPIVSQISEPHLILSHLIYGLTLNFRLGQPTTSSNGG